MHRLLAIMLLVTTSVGLSFGSPMLARAQTATTANPPPGVTVGPSGTDSSYLTVSDSRGFSFDVPSDWSFDSTREPDGYHMTSSDALVGMTITVLTSAGGINSPGEAATFLTAQLQHDNEAYLGFRIRQDPYGFPSRGWNSVGQAEDRFTNDNGQDEGHVYTVGLSGGLTVLLDWSWIGTLPGSELLPGNLTYTGSPPASPPASTVPATSLPATAGVSSATTPGSAAVAGFLDSGTTSKQTKSFTVPASWSIQYTYDCTRFANSLSGGFLNIFVMYPTGAYLLGDSSPIELQGVGDAGGDVVPFSTQGTFYLSVVTPCSWAITIPEAASSGVSHP